MAGLLVGLLLQEIVEQGSPLKQFALPILCDIPKASKRARAELKLHNGVQFFLTLLSTDYWQEKALDALLKWLDDEGPHVAKYMSSSHGVGQLRVILESKSASSFVTMLPLLKQVRVHAWRLRTRLLLRHHASP